MVRSRLVYLAPEFDCTVYVPLDKLQGRKKVPGGETSFSVGWTNPDTIPDLIIFLLWVFVCVCILGGEFFVIFVLI